MSKPVPPPKPAQLKPIASPREQDPNKAIPRDDNRQRVSSFQRKMNAMSGFFKTKGVAPGTAAPPSLYLASGNEYEADPDAFNSETMVEVPIPSSSSSSSSSAPFATTATTATPALPPKPNKPPKPTPNASNSAVAPHSSLNLTINPLRGSSTDLHEISMEDDNDPEKQKKKPNATASSSAGYLGPSWLPRPLQFEKQTLHQYRFWIAAACIFGLLLIIAPVATYYGLNGKSGSAPASTVVGEAAASAFVMSAGGDVAVTPTSLFTIPYFYDAIRTATGSDSLVLRKATKVQTTVTNWARDTWATQVRGLLPFAASNISVTYCGKSTLYGIFDTDCCMTVTVDAETALGLTLDSMVSRGDLQGFLSCDFNSTWSPLVAIPGLASAVASRPGSWFNSLQFTSNGKFVISSVDVERKDISIKAGLNLFAKGALVSPPSSVVSALTPLLSKPVGSVEYAVSAFFPYRKDSRTFTAVDSRISLVIGTNDLSFGSSVVEASIALELSGLGVSPFFYLNGFVGVTFSKDNGASTPIYLTFSSSYTAGEPVYATGKLFGPVSLFSVADWAVLKSATVTAEFTAPPQFALRYLEFAGVGKIGFGDSPANDVNVYARIEKTPTNGFNIAAYSPSIPINNIGAMIASRAPGALANVITAFTSNKVVSISVATADMLVSGRLVKRGLGVFVNGVALKDAVAADVSSAIAKATAALTTTNVQVAAFLPLFTTGTMYTVQVTAQNIAVNSRLQFSNVYFALNVSSTFSTASLAFGGVVNVYLPSDQVVAFNMAGSFVSSTNAFSASGALAAPWVRPFGLPVLTVLSASAALSLSPSLTSIAFSTSFRLDYADARPSVTLSGSYSNGDFYLYNPAGNAISPFIPSIVKQFVDFDGNVYLYLSTSDQVLSGRPVSRGLTLAAENLSLKFSNSPIAQTLNNILGAALPNGIPNVRLYYPVFGPMGSSVARRDAVSDLLYGTRLDRTWSTRMTLPDINLWSNTLAFTNNTLSASFNPAAIANTQFALSTVLRFSSNGQSFSYAASASFGSGSTAFSMAGTLPQWTNPLGLSWLRVGTTAIAASFSSANPSANRLDVGTRLFFGPVAAPTVDVAVRGQITSSGMFLAVYDVSAAALASLVTHALKSIATIPNADSLISQLSGLNIGLAISTNPSRVSFTADSGKVYEIESGINFIVSSQKNARVCTTAELSTRTDCENPTLSLIKQVIPTQFRAMGFRFGLVLPATPTGAAFKLFVETDTAITIHSRVSLLWLKLSAEFSVGTARRADMLSNIASEMSTVVQGMGHSLDAPMTPELLHAYHTRLRRAGATGSLEISTRFSFQADASTRLLFQVSGKIASDATGVNVRAFGYMYGSGWNNAFGISGLTLNAATVGLGFGSVCPPCLTFVQLGASISIGRRTVSFIGAFDISAFGGFLKASYSGPAITLIDLLQLVNVFKPNTINMNALPGWLSDIFALRALSIQLASSSMTIPDFTQITADSTKQISDLPMITISPGFYFNASLTVLAIDADIYLAYIQSPLPDFRMSLFFSFAKINARLDAFTNNLRSLSDVPILSNILSIPEVQNILNFRINSISVADFSTLGMITGTSSPTASLTYTYSGSTRTISFTMSNLGVDVLDIIVQNVDTFPNCMVDSMCPSGQKCYHHSGGAWRCRPLNADGSCQFGMFSYKGTGCWPNGLIDSFVNWAKAVSDTFTDGFNAIENGVNDAVKSVGGLFG